MIGIHSDSKQPNTLKSIHKQQDQKLKNTIPIIKQSPKLKTKHSSYTENTCTYRSSLWNFESTRIGAQIWWDRRIHAAENPAM